MHLRLTDRLVCPRCGPDFGLILLANEIRDQRVMDGELGCPNCRQTYPVRGGFGDLRAPGHTPLAAKETYVLEAPLELGKENADETLRLGALLGVTEGPGALLISGPAAGQALLLAQLLSGVEVVALHEGQRREAETEGVSRMAAGSELPFLPGSFRGVVLSGEITETDFHEAARVTAAPGRVVVLSAPPEIGQWAEARRMEILLEEEGVVVARSQGSGSRRLVTLRGL